MSKKELQGVLHRTIIKFMIIRTFFEEYKPHKRFTPELFWHDGSFSLKEASPTCLCGVNDAKGYFVTSRGPGAAFAVSIVHLFFRFGVWREALLERMQALIAGLYRPYLRTRNIYNHPIILSIQPYQYSSQN